MKSKILILDFGGQYSHLISRRIRDLGVFAELVPFNLADQGHVEDCSGIILSGGPRSVGEQSSPKLPQSITQVLDNRSKPVLGICYGHQLLGDYFGGTVSRSDSEEYGKTIVQINQEENRILLPKAMDSISTWMSHGDNVVELGPDFVKTGSSDSCPISAMRSKDNRIFGLQFHPEVTHTEGGFDILQRFAVDICKITPGTWTMESYKDALLGEIRRELVGSKVLIGVSGGVDSMVAALVLSEVLKDNLHLVFINHGLLRANEVEDVCAYYEKQLKLPNFHYVDAEDNFIDKLVGETDPEEKRRIIGHTFIEVFEEIANKLEADHGEFTYLAQGTLFTDRVESGAVGDTTAKIKSHHNLTLPEKMKLRIIEPLKELYKDEVRELGIILGAPSHLINRYPFPGPGLAVRILGSITRSKIDILQRSDKIFIDYLYNNDLHPQVHENIWQAFAVLLSGKAVGVQGDNRTYGHIIALRAVSSVDGMTADFAPIPFDLLGLIANKIINQIPEITRVVYDLTSKPPGTIEFE
jgi:GMP synthase (glutamine-hydrolysing)